MTHTINTSEATAVSNETYLQPMDTCPIGVKVQLENKEQQDLKAHKG